MLDVSVLYVLPTENYGPEHMDYALRFVATYLSYPPGMNHNLYVISNGGAPSPCADTLFSTIPSFKGFLTRNDNFAKDIGAFQFGARALAADMFVFFGGNTYLKREGWMARMVWAFQSEGDHLFGSFGSLVSRPHIRTTGFWCSKDLFTRYPRIVRNDDERYTFEHRDGSLTDYAKSLKKKALMVTWTGVYGEGAWHMVKNGYHNGDHSECLVADRVSDMVQPVK